MFDQSHIVHLHTMICLRFITTTMYSHHPQLSDRELHKIMVTCPENTTPIVLDFSSLTCPDEWQE